MAVIISNGPTSLSTVNGFYRVEAYNLSCMYLGAGLSLSAATRYIPFTPANAGNCLGVVLAFTTLSTTTSASVVVTLQEDAGGGWADVAGATVTLSTADIAGTVITRTYKNRGSFLTPCIIGTPAAVTTDANRWRWKVQDGGGVGVWTIRTSDGTNPFHATWCDNAVTFADDDVIVCKDKVIVDCDATLGAVLGTGDADNGISAIVCSNSADPSPLTMARLEWENPPAASYELTVGGTIVVQTFGGVRIGESNTAPVTISNASPGVVTLAGHGLVADQMVSFETTGTLPSPLDDTRGVYYYVKTVIDPDTFTLSATPGGATIDTTTDGSGVHTIEWGRIPTAERAIVTFTAPVVGTKTASFTFHTSTTSYTYGTSASYFFYGQIPRYQYTELASNAATGQKNLVCTDNVDWVNGDQVVAGKQNAKSQGDTAIYTIDSVAGDTITLTANLATAMRIAGGTVLRLGGHGVLLQNTSAQSVHLVNLPANMVFSGVDLKNQSVSFSNSSWHYLLSALDPAYRSQVVSEDVTMWADNVTAYRFFMPDIPPDGVVFRRCYAHRQSLATSAVSRYRYGFYSGRLELLDCRALCNYNNVLSTDGRIKLSIERCKWENSRAASFPVVWLTGADMVFVDNSFWGTGNSEANGGAVGVGACISPRNISGNTYDNCACAMSFGPYASVGCIDHDAEFGSETANTLDLGYIGGCYPDYTFVSPTGSLVYSDDTLADMTVGGRVRIQDWDDTSTDDRVLYSTGKTQRTNAALPDATVHTAGGSAIRFEPTAEGVRFNFVFDVPTGNILGKTMAVAVWCKLNHANYWAGASYEMPRLTVRYDDATEVYAEAAQNTDWQLLSVYFAPTTATGKIIVTISGMTDAIGSDRYFYWDDFSCYDEKTEVLTKTGWKFFKDVQLGEEAMTLNPATWEMEYSKVVNKIERKVDTKMYRIDSKSVDLLVTPDHMLWGLEKSDVRWKLKRAVDFKGKAYRMAKVGEWEGEEVENFIIPATERLVLNRWYGTIPYAIPEKTVKMDDWLEFLGYYLSEGCAFRHGTKKNPNCHYAVVLTQNDGPVFEKMKAVVKRLGFNYYIPKKVEGVSRYLKIADKQLFDYCIQFGHAEDKYVPQELMNLSSRQLSILLGALMDGDGHVLREGGGYIYSTISNQLADDVQEIMLKVGKPSSIYKSPSGGKDGSPTGNTMYRVKTVEKYSYPWVNIDLNRKTRKPSCCGDGFVNYNGMVYCLTVEKNHILYVRRNGKALWCGNCLYPAGYAMNLGGLDIWDLALPVLPPISTLSNAMDVWGIAASTVFGADTMGRLVKDTGTKVDDACALILTK